MWFIGVEVEQETSTPPPEKNPGSAPEIWLRDYGVRMRRWLDKWASAVMVLAVSLLRR